MKDFFNKHRIDFIIAPILITVGLICNIAVFAEDTELSTDKYGTDINGNSEGINWGAIVDLATLYGTEKAQLLETFADEMYYLYYQYSNGNAELAESIVTAILKAEKFYFETQDTVLTVKLGFQNGVETIKGLLLQMAEDGFSPLYWGDLIDGDVDTTDMTTDITADDLAVSGDIFNQAVTSINNANYYIPEITSDRQVLSYQNCPYDSTNYIQPWNSSARLPLRYKSDLFLGVGWSEVYLLGFVKDDDLTEGTYYAQYQIRLYHQVVDGVVQMLADIIPTIDGDGVEGIVLSEDASAYPYVFISPYCWNNRVFDTKGFINFGDFVNATNDNNYYTYDDSTQVFMQVMSSEGYLQCNARSLVTASTLTFESNENDDIGYLCQQTPFVMDYSPIPDAVTDLPTNYYVTINGDNVYDYSITNPDTGESTTINYYITNNNFSDDGDEGSGSGDGSSSIDGDITVNGTINVNVNHGDGLEIDPEVSLENYYEWTIKETEGLRGFLGDIFSFLPSELLGLLGLTIGGVCVARFLGR